MAIRHTFKVYERLKREQHIHTLFRTGKAFSVFPVKFIYRIVPAEGIAEKGSNVQVGFSVPKKKFRSSVDRHRVRRLMVESWRLNKHILIESMPGGCTIHIFLIFLNPELPEYAPVETAVTTGIKKLCEIVKQNAQ